MTDQFRPPKQWCLTENETITSFSSWQSNMIYHLSLNNEFSPYLDSDWSKKSTPNRGLVNDPESVEAASRKTATQKAIILERMLGLISQFVPSLLRSEVIKKSTSLSWIWARVRKYYSFSHSEVNFLKLYEIKQLPNERYETLFQRIIAHLEDNLITIASGIVHDGESPTVDEELSPTAERLAVYLWLTIIDPRLPSYVARVYSKDLQTHSLKDIQPRIAENLDSLLEELNTQEEIHVQYSRTPQKFAKKYQFSKKSKATAKSFKSCLFCKNSGRQNTNHDTSSCWFISKFDKRQMARALSVETDDVCDEADDDDDDIHDISTSQSRRVEIKEETDVIGKVDIDVSPYFFAFHNSHTVHVVVDSGAQSSLVSSAFLRRAGIDIEPTLHRARAVDKSPISLSGEVRINLEFGELELPISALVVEKLDSDILAGVPWCKEHKVVVDFSKEVVQIKNITIRYGEKITGPQHDIYSVESFIIRNDSKKVLLPGDYFELESEDLKGYEGEIAIEPFQQDKEKSWPPHSMSRVIQGKVRIANATEELVHISKSEHIAKIRRVIVPELIEPSIHVNNLNSYNKISSTSETCKPSSLPEHDDNTALIVIDPNQQLKERECEAFRRLNKAHAKVFTSKFGAYNDCSGKIRANVNIGPVIPPSKKTKLPFYSNSNLKLLQEEADKLESLGVLAKPEDVGVEIMYASPSFLRQKPAGGHRFITAFNELSEYVRVPPSVSMSCNDVLRKLSSWKYLIKSDLTKSFYQIKVSKSSMPYLATVTPFKGVRVYTRCAMGMPGSSEILHELIARVLGDFIAEGFVITIADDIFVGGNTVEELLRNWQRVLERLQENNLSLSATKTEICPLKTTILGWIWKSGTLTASPHKIAPLSSVDPPKTCTGMRSFIGAFKALSRCFHRYSSLISPLEDCLKGLQGAQHVIWSEELLSAFKNVQDVLKNPSILTIPRSSDQLVLCPDASPVNKGIGATLYVIREGNRLLAEFFSVKLKAYQADWQPCELEALSITSATKHFSPYILESCNPLRVNTDSKPCVEAFNKMKKGHFSASARISSFLSTLSCFRITMSHIKGVHNVTGDYASRHPQECDSEHCQICKFVSDTVSAVVRVITVNDILSGTAKMPFLNHSAWKSAQHDCSALRRTFAHLTQGTRPARKARNLKDVRRYLQVASISNDGLLIAKKADNFGVEHKLIIIPRAIIPGLITALHLFLSHPLKTQMTKIFNRYFFGLNSVDVIDSVTKACDKCNALKKMKPELFQQSSTPSPKHPGVRFTSDIMRRSGQKIMLTREIFTNYTTGIILDDEKHSQLRTGLISTTELCRMPSCIVHVDNALGFQALKDDKELTKHGISLEFGHIKNENKNAVADKCIQEFEDELKRIDLSCSPISTTILDSTLSVLNKRVRNRGYSAREHLIQRDQFTGEQLELKDKDVAAFQSDTRRQNHSSSALSKGKGGTIAKDANVKSGDLVYIKQEGDKFHLREKYLVVSTSNHFAMLQKMSNGKISSKKYEVPLNRIYRALPGLVIHVPDESDSSETDNDYDLRKNTESDNESDHNTANEIEPASGLVPQDHHNQAEEMVNEEEEASTPESTQRHSERNAKPPLRFSDQYTHYYQ